MISETHKSKTSQHSSWPLWAWHAQSALVIASQSTCLSGLPSATRAGGSRRPWKSKLVPSAQPCARSHSDNPRLLTSHNSQSQVWTIEIGMLQISSFLCPAAFFSSPSKPRPSLSFRKPPRRSTPPGLDIALKCAPAGQSRPAAAPSARITRLEGPASPAEICHLQGLGLRKKQTVPDSLRCSIGGVTVTPGPAGTCEITD